ncbi:toll/interleukin-1 receptor domain-containing protein [Virgibacillus sediminis]|uniref:Toll/interleukin-1 receptor domain-containing protein n=1 Tax=Virgibacillus sediminis TaxID=202260 RepID=A0ABV7A4B7_9BACI
MDFKYDVTVSFAGEDRNIIEPIALELHRKGVSIFYDKLAQSDLWGKDLYQHLAEVYSSKAKYCIIFVSAHYLKKSWTKHELKSAQSRSFQQDQEYILPIKLDDSEVPGLPITLGYLDARQMNTEELLKIILDKLGFENKKKDTILFWKIRSVINANDPMDLLSLGRDIDVGPPSDEYDPEIEEIYDILPLAKSPEELSDGIIRIFAKYFSVEDALRFRNYSKLSEEIWELKDGNSLGGLYNYGKGI